MRHARRDTNCLLRSVGEFSTNVSYLETHQRRVVSAVKANILRVSEVALTEALQPSKRDASNHAAHRKPP